jgi:ATP-binding cassette, subfamily C (CFTR/MRP), member 1
MDGLETLRTFAWHRYAIDYNDCSVENAQRPEFLLLALQRWMNLVLDLMAAALGIIIIAIIVAKRDDVSVGQVGVALNVVLAVNVTLLRLVESWTSLEMSLGAVARLKRLEEHTPSEMETVLWPVVSVLLQSWQIKGRVEMKDVTASYQ